MQVLFQPGVLLQCGVPLLGQGVKRLPEVYKFPSYPTGTPPLQQWVTLFVLRSTSRQTGR